MPGKAQTRCRIFRACARRCKDIGEEVGRKNSGIETSGAKQTLAAERKPVIHDAAVVHSPGEPIVDDPLFGHLLLVGICVPELARDDDVRMNTSDRGPSRWIQRQLGEITVSNREIPQTLLVISVVQLPTVPS
jgi:hypothetical protein